jgi:hypothetical protein
MATARHEGVLPSPMTPRFPKTERSSPLRLKRPSEELDVGTVHLLHERQVRAADLERSASRAMTRPTTGPS